MTFSLPLKQVGLITKNVDFFNSIKVNGDERFKNENTRHNKSSPYDLCDAFSMFSIVKWLYVINIQAGLNLCRNKPDPDPTSPKSNLAPHFV